MTLAAEANYHIEGNRMDFEAILETSRKHQGMVDTAMYVVSEAVAASGANTETKAQLEQILSTALEGLSERDRVMLGWVLDQRVSEDHGQGVYSGLVCLSSRMTIVEAHIVHDALVGGGVDTRVRRQHRSAADVLHPHNGAEIWVHPRHYERGLAIMEELDATSEKAVPCGTCGEENPGHFGSCWNCGAALTPIPVDSV